MAIVILLTSQLLARPQGASAVPIKNHTALRTEYAPPWVADPSSRGTWSLLFSCLFTLGVCVWSAIHLNIPPRGEPEIKQFLRKTKWVVVAIFAPEVVLFSAWQQIYQARKFCKEMQRVRLEQEGLSYVEKTMWWGRLWEWIQQTIHWSTNSQSPQTCSPPTAAAKLKQKEEIRLTQAASFSLTYGFYVVMGGLTVNVSDVYDRISTLTLTPAGTLDLARKTSWTYFQVPDDQIRDKSKADNLVKALAFLQVTWMLLQCISRQILGYPLTALEVHVLAHSACALVMHAMWFRKPLDIGDASDLDPTPFAEELALQLLRSPGSAYAPFRNFVLPNRHQRLSSTPTRINPFRKLVFGSVDMVPWPDPRVASEATFLLFDLARASTIEAAPSACDVPTQESPFSVSLGHDTTETQPDPKLQTSSADYILQDIANNGADLESSNSISLLPLRSFTGLEEPAAISIMPPPGVKIVQTLTTGQTLRNGIGPNTFMTSSKQKWRYYVTDRFPFLKRFLTIVGINVQERYHVVEISERLKRRIVYPIESLATSLFQKVAISLSQKDLLRWQRAGRALLREMASEEAKARLSNSRAVPELRSIEMPLSHLHAAFSTGPVVRRSRNLDFYILAALADADESKNTVLSMFYSMALISGLYAGIHLALWNYDFPTQTESILWKISACALGTPAALAGIAFAVVLVISLFQFLGNVVEKFYLVTWLFGQLAWLYQSNSCIRCVAVAIFLSLVITPSIFIYPLAIFAVAGGSPLYFFGRLYIVAESFISLRRVPIGVYEEVTWAQQIPHL